MCLKFSFLSQVDYEIRYVKLTRGWLLKLNLGQLDKVHEHGQVDWMVTLWSSRQGNSTMVYGHGEQSH